MSTALTSLPLLWANCVERLKDRVNNRSFWEALELTQPITIEDDTLIIGLEPANFNRATHILQTSTMNTVLTTIAEYFGNPLKLRLIEGLTLADWETAKEHDVRIAAMRQTTTARQEKEDSQDHSWDSLGEYLSRLYSQMPIRSLPQGKARYANEALYAVVEAMDTLYPEPADESAERGLARMLERIGLNSEIPAPMLAFELERLRAWRKAGA